MASASKDETVIIWDMTRIKQNLNKTHGIDEQDYIISMIDDHEHVIDAIKFAPDAACQVIQKSDYYSGKRSAQDNNQTVDSEAINNSTSDMSFDNPNAVPGEETKRNDEGDSGYINPEQRLTTKEKVQKLKEDLRMRKAILRGEVEEAHENHENIDDSI